MVEVSLSLRAADVARLGEQLRIVQDAGAQVIHIDVCDGHFAPDVSFGVPIVESIGRATNFTLDVHLLVERPERFVADLIRVGAQRVAVHPESTTDLLRLLRMIRSRGAQAGVALLPGTPVETVSEVVSEMDFLNILSADPGTAEETYIPQSASKVKRAAELRSRSGASFELHAEGGICVEHIEELLTAGADGVVAGKAAFAEPDPKASLREFMRWASNDRGERPVAHPSES